MNDSMMADATSTDDNPTSGYLLTEISRATLANYEANVRIQEYLMNRIKKDNHNVKYKCLVIIKHVCRTGRAEFKKEIGRNVKDGRVNLEPIKECLQYRGPPDDLRGDEIYKRVREAARETLDAIFDSQMPVTQSAVAMTNRIQGISSGYEPEAPKQNPSYLSRMSKAVSSYRASGEPSSTYVGHAGATGSFNGSADDGSRGAATGSTYQPQSYQPQASATVQQQQWNTNGAASSGGNSNSNNTYSSNSTTASGFGNPQFTDARDEKSYSQRAYEYVNGKTAHAGANNGSAAPSQSGPNDYNFASNRGGNPFAKDTGSPASNAAKTSVWGGGAVQTQQSLITPANPGVSMGMGMVPDLPVQADGMGRAGQAATDGAYEEGLISVLCEPAGLKPVPPQDKYVSFLQTAPNLSPALLNPVIDSFLQHTSWISRAKALVVVAGLATTVNCQDHVSWWVDPLHSAILYDLYHTDGRPTVRNQALKTLKALKLDLSNVAAAPATGNAHKPRAAAPVVPANADLLGSFDEMPVNAPAPALAMDINNMGLAPPVTVGTGADWMNVGASTPAPTVPLVPPQSAAPALDIFAGLSVEPAVNNNLMSANMVPTQPTQLAPAALPVQPSAGMDIFSGLSVGPAAPAPPAASAMPNAEPMVDVSPMSVFDFMTDSPANAPPQQMPSNNNAFNMTDAPAQRRVSGEAFNMSGQNMNFGMLSPTAARKSIPVVASDVPLSGGGTNSGFSFMSNPQGPSPAQGNHMNNRNNTHNAGAKANGGGIDSFSFVQDAMGSSKPKPLSNIRK